MQGLKTLRAAFQNNLDAQTQEKAWKPNERAIWILEHLDEYIERWLGFAAMSVDPRALIQSDVFTVVEIAVDALEQECARLDGSSGGRHLESMRHALEELRQHGNREHALTLRNLGDELRSMLITH